MRKITIITLLFVFVLGASLALAGFGLPGGGPKLKAEKKEMKLGDLNAKYAKYEGTDSDPFKDKPYEYNAFGDSEIDTFLSSSHKVSATMQFANLMVNDLYKKVDAAKDAKELETLKADAQMLSGILTAIPADATKLAAAGTGLIKNSPNKFKKNPMNLKVLPELIKDLKGCLDCLKKAGEEAKTLGEKIVPLMSKIKEKAATFAG